jgi:CheY-like chemotaxis protein
MPLGRVLVVDDDPELRAVLHEALTELDYVVESAGSGAEALERMPVFQPEVVLLDVTMPGMKGDEVLERLRHEYPRVPVVMVTALEDEGRARRLLNSGAFDYVRKPFDLRMVERVIVAALGWSPRPPGPAAR